MPAVRGNERDPVDEIVGDEDSSGHTTGTSSRVSPTLQAQARRQRKFSRKSKDGCVSCKSRRVKCGEEKPSCRTCVSRKSQVSQRQGGLFPSLPGLILLPWPCIQCVYPGWSDSAEVPRTESEFARALAESIKALQHPSQPCPPFDLALSRTSTDDHALAGSTSSSSPSTVAGVPKACLSVCSWPNTYHATDDHGGFPTDSFRPLCMNMFGSGTTSGWFPSAATLPPLDNANTLKPFYPEEQDRMLVSPREQPKAGRLL